MSSSGRTPERGGALRAIVEPGEMKVIDGVPVVSKKGLIQACRAVIAGRAAGNRATAARLLTALESPN